MWIHRLHLCLQYRSIFAVSFCFCSGISNTLIPTMEDDIEKDLGEWDFIGDLHMNGTLSLTGLSNFQYRRLKQLQNQ